MRGRIIAAAITALAAVSVWVVKETLDTATAKAVLTITVAGHGENIRVQGAQLEAHREQLASLKALQAVAVETQRQTAETLHELRVKVEQPARGRK